MICICERKRWENASVVLPCVCDSVCTRFARATAREGQKGSSGGSAAQRRRCDSSGGRAVSMSGRSQCSLPSVHSILWTSDMPFLSLSLSLSLSNYQTFFIASPGSPPTSSSSSRIASLSFPVTISARDLANHQLHMQISPFRVSTLKT